MYKILVLKNRVDVPIEDDFSKAITYYKGKGIDVSFDFKEIDVPVSCHFYLVANDGQRYYGIDDYVKDSCDKYVEKGKYHAVVFAWNTKDVPTPTDGQLTSWGNWSPISWQKADTEFIQLITNDYNDKVDWIYKSIIHEIMHTICFRFNRRGFRVIDEMDMTILPTGEKIPYYKNSEPDAVDGNFAQTFENIKPYMDKIYDFYFIDQEKPPTVFKKGDYGVSQLQRDLKALGYFKYPVITGYFGSVTESAVKAFQRANSLYVDGIVGPKTLQKIEELKKKPNFGLDPKVEALAYLLIAKCKQLYGYNIRIVEGYRTQDRQNYLYASGRTYPGPILTKTLKSKHTERKAFDICFVGKDPYPNDGAVWKRIADVGVSIGLKAGHYFESRDSVHFEV